MAFIKPTPTPSGYIAEYIVLGPYFVDRRRREARATFHFYKDKATADANGAPACPQVATLRLEGAGFDRWFSKPAKQAAAGRGETLEDAAILYRAAKVENIVCDFGEVAYYPKKNPDDKNEQPRPNGYRLPFKDAQDDV